MKNAFNTNHSIIMLDTPELAEYLEELMNELSKHIYFAPIGVNNYWDAQWIVANGIVTGQPIPEFTKEADDKLREGNK